MVMERKKKKKKKLNMHQTICRKKVMIEELNHRALGNNNCSMEMLHILILTIRKHQA